MNREESVLRPVKVLLCGMKMPENQITRALARYPNVTVTWKPGDPGVNWPTDHDAVVIPIIQCSHAAYYTVKELYKGKPTFVIREGFSEMKEKFEKWLDGIPALPGQPKTALAQAFEAAKTRELNDVTIETVTVEPEEIKVSGQGKYDRSTMNRDTPFARRVRWTNNFIWTEKAKGNSNLDIAKAISNFGFRTRNGKKWKSSTVQLQFMALKRNEFTPDPKVLQTGPPSDAAEAAPVTPGKRGVGRPRKEEITVTAAAPAVAKTAATSDAHSIASLILESNLTKEQKLEMLKVVL